MQNIAEKLLLPVLLIVAHQASAQCPTPTLLGPEVMWLPEWGQYLDTATVGQTFQDHLEVFVPADSSYNLGGDPVTVDVIGFWLDSITGLPDGFTYSPDPPEGLFAGGYPACVAFDGLPTLANAGLHTLTAYFRAEVDFGTVTFFDFTHLIRLLVVEPAAVRDLDQPELKAWATQGGVLNVMSQAQATVQISVYDALGRAVEEMRNVSLQPGQNRIELTQRGIVCITQPDGRCLRLLVY